MMRVMDIATGPEFTGGGLMGLFAIVFVVILLVILSVVILSHMKSKNNHDVEPESESREPPEDLTNS